MREPVGKKGDEGKSQKAAGKKKKKTPGITGIQLISDLLSQRIFIGTETGRSLPSVFFSGTVCVHLSIRPVAQYRFF